MKSKIVAIVVSFLVVGGSAVAYAAGWGDVAANTQVASSAMVEGTSGSVIDSIVLFIIGVVGLSAARRHFKSVV